MALNFHPPHNRCTKFSRISRGQKGGAVLSKSYQKEDKYVPTWNRVGHGHSRDVCPKERKGTKFNLYWIWAHPRAVIVDPTSSDAQHQHNRPCMYI